MQKYLLLIILIIFSGCATWVAQGTDLDPMKYPEFGYVAVKLIDEPKQGGGCLFAFAQEYDIS